MLVWFGTKLAPRSTGDTMRVAIPEHQCRVAPVFDCCGRILIFLQDQNGEELLTDENWLMLPRLSRAGRLRELTIELLVCGGISCCMEEQIRRHGIALVPWIAGNIAEVLAALRTGKITDPSFAMPGRVGCARRNQFGKNLSTKRSGTAIFRKEHDHAWIR